MSFGELHVFISMSFFNSTLHRCMRPIAIVTVTLVLPNVPTVPTELSVSVSMFCLEVRHVLERGG